MATACTIYIFCQSYGEGGFIPGSERRYVLSVPVCTVRKDLPNNQIRVPSNTTVYLAPGAVLKAKLLVDNAENVRIIGRGILDHPVRGIEITDSENVLVDGITVVNPEHYTVFGGGSSDIVIRNLKSFSCRSWSDGIDMMCCRKVLCR